MEKLKANWSRWIKEPGAVEFWWQPGHAAFSVGQPESERVKGYIHRHREHHQGHSFEHELRALCGCEPADAAALDKFLRPTAPGGGTLGSQRCSPWHKVACRPYALSTDSAAKSASRAINVDVTQADDGPAPYPQR
jgi:hypothetical protein